MSETSDEKFQVAENSEVRPPVILPETSLPEQDRVAIIQSELELARSEYYLGHYKELLSKLPKLITKLEQEGKSNDPRFDLLQVAALSLQGQTWQRLQQDQEARDSFKLAVTKFRESFSADGPPPGTLDIYSDYGTALYHLGQTAEAAKSFAIGAKNNSLNAEAYRLYGMSLSQQPDNSNLTLAEEQFRKSLNLNPTDPLSLEALGENLKAQGRVAEAVDSYWRAAAYLVSSGRIDEAEKDIEGALDINPHHAELLMMKGYTLVFKGRHEDALLTIDESLSLAPDNAATLALKGQTLAILSRETEAVEYLQRAVATNPSDASVFFMLGALFRKLKDYNKALEALNKALDLAPDYALALVGKGRVLHDLNRNEEACELLQRAVELDPTLGLAFSILGKTLIKLERYEDALKAIDQAISLLPNELDLAVDKARALLGLGRAPEALQLLQAEVKTKPDSVAAQTELANALLANRTFDEALKAVDEALKLNPTEVHALVVKGRILRNLDRHQEAVDILQEAVKIDPSDAEAYAQLGASLKKVGRLSESLEALDKALVFRPNFLLALRYKGETLRDMERYDEALAVLDHALELFPEDSWLLVSKGSVLRLSNRPSEAVELLQRAVAKDQELPKGWAELGAALYTQEDKEEEALTAFDRALALKPNYDLALKYKGETLRFLGRYEEALICLDRALAVSPNDPWTLGSKGQTLRALRREPEASEVLKLAVKEGPKLSWAWAELGFSYYTQEMPIEALAALKESLAVTFNVDCALFAAIIHAAIAEYDSALEILSPAIEVNTKANAKDPKNGDLHGARGWVLENQGIKDASESYRDYQIANELQPDDLNWKTGIGNSLYRLRKLEEAREWYEEVLSAGLAVAQPSTDTLSLIGWTYYRLQNYEEAMKSFIALVRDNPGAVSEQFNLALTLFGNNSSPLGLREYERGIEMAKRKPEPLRRGWFHVALNDMRIATSIQPDVYDKDEFGQARKLMEKALEEARNPSPPIVQNECEKNADSAPT